MCTQACVCVYVFVRVAVAHRNGLGRDEAGRVGDAAELVERHARFGRTRGRLNAVECGEYNTQTHTHTKDTDSHIHIAFPTSKTAKFRTRLPWCIMSDSPNSDQNTGGSRPVWMTLMSATRPTITIHTYTHTHQRHTTKHPPHQHTHTQKSSHTHTHKRTHTYM